MSAAAPLLRAEWRTILREFGLIVAGVLVALAAQAWWEQRAERHRAEAYLQQLIGDLRTSEEELRASAARTRLADAAAASVVRAFYAPERASSDSVLVWMTRSLGYSVASVSLGSAQAMISTGDLRLIRDDSVRAEIVGLLDLAKQYELHQRVAVDEFYRAAAAVTDIVNLNELNAVRSGPALDSLAALDPTIPIPPGATTHPFAMDIPAMLRREDLFRSMAGLENALGLLAVIQDGLAERIVGTRERIEAAVGDP